MKKSTRLFFEYKLLDDILSSENGLVVGCVLQRGDDISHFVDDLHSVGPLVAIQFQALLNEIHHLVHRSILLGFVCCASQRLHLRDCCSADAIFSGLLILLPVRIVVDRRARTRRSWMSPFKSGSEMTNISYSAEGSTNRALLKRSSPSWPSINHTITSRKTHASAQMSACTPCTFSPSVSGAA